MKYTIQQGPFFPLTKKAIEISKRMFNGKIVRVIIANGGLSKNSADNLSSVFRGVSVFPENWIPNKECLSFVDKMCQETKGEDILIVTNSLGIISSVPHMLVRVIQDGGVLEDLTDEEGVITKTFAANIGELFIDLHKSVCSVNAARTINDINARMDKVTEDEIADFKETIELIGETLIVNVLKSKLLN